MKTSHTLTTFAALLMIVLIAVAGTNFRPNVHKGGTGINKLFSNSLLKNEDPVKLERKQLTSDRTKAIKITAPRASENDFSYLRFDVSKFINNSESEITELPVSDLSYLHFDVNKFMNESKIEIAELPASEPNYLRFDVNKYMEQNPGNINEIPADEFSYLRFDVNRFIKSDLANGSEIIELPVAE